MRKRIEAVSPVVATILMVAMTVVLTALLYIMVLGMTGGDVAENTRWGSIELQTVSLDSFDAKVSKIEPPARPLDLKVLVEYNDTQGTYAFASNQDGDLNFHEGVDICDIAYNDQADDGYVSQGDYMRFTNLISGGEYKVYILDATTGGLITTRTIDLPG